MSSSLLPYFLMIPAGLGFLIPLLGRSRIRPADTLAALGTGLLLALSLFTLGKTGKHLVGGWPQPIGITLALDPLSSLMLTLIAGLGLCASIFSIRALDRHTGRSHYYSLFLLMIAGMNGVALTRDLFNLYVFLELASISSYALVAFSAEAEDLEAGFKYAILSGLGSIFILLGIAVVYLCYGTVNLPQLAERLALAPAGELKNFSLILLLAGFCIKAGLIPFHFWLPDAHPAAPAPVSAMLSGILIKALGLYALARLLFNVYGLSPGLGRLLLGLGALSMIGGVLLAIGQNDFKRMLAYHSISQIGYIALAFGLGTPLGIMAGIYHLVNHAAFKSLLFLSAGAVEYRTGTRDLNELGGLRARMPVTSAASLVGSLSIAGVPPLNGFFSKLLIIFACVQAGRQGLAAAAVIVSILTLASFMKVQRAAFFGPLKDKWTGLKEVPFSMQLSLFLLMAACLALSLLVLPGLREQFLNSAQAVLSAGIMPAGGSR